MEHGFFATGAWALRLFWCKAERAVTTRHEMQPNAPRQHAAFIWVSKTKSYVNNIVKSLVSLIEVFSALDAIAYKGLL